MNTDCRVCKLLSGPSLLLGLLVLLTRYHSSILMCLEVAWPCSQWDSTQ